MNQRSDARSSADPMDFPNLEVIPMNIAQLNRPAAAVALGLICWAGGCGGPRPAAPPAEPSPAVLPAVPAAAAAPVKKLDGRHEFTLRGVVRAVDPAEGEVTIAHEAMPGFMEAMVMPFLIRDKSVLDDVRPGDVVHGPMVVLFRNGSIKDYQLTDLTVTGTAPPKSESPDPAARPGTIPPAPLKVGDLVPDFHVTTQTGAALNLADLRGQVVALTFVYTRCPLPDFCPAVDLKFADLARRLAIHPERARHVTLLSVSFDPTHDTPEVLQAHARLRGAKAPWTFAVADAPELARVGPLLGLDYYPERDQFAHNLATAVIGPDGRLARLELGRTWTPADLLKTITSLIPTSSTRPGTLR